MKQRTPATAGQNSTPALGAARQPERPRDSWWQHRNSWAVAGGGFGTLCFFFCFFLEQICEPRLVGGVCLRGASPSTPGLPPPAECVMCPMEKTLQRHHIFSRPDQTFHSSQRCRPAPCKLTRAPAGTRSPQLRVPSHLPTASLGVVLSFPRSFPGDRRDAPRFGRSDPGAAGEDARERPNLGERG